ncbi:MAG TPA: SgcJ/EcaC family oxidoreductase [Alloacidobacterium sp.]|nr:SgcJ/EcaC family oxidoreductase [Alloacidobacterium sp.]
MTGEADIKKCLSILIALVKDCVHRNLDVEFFAVGIQTRWMTMRRMKRIFPLVLVLLWIVSARAVFAQDAESAIKQVLADQVSAWNRGDISTFMQGYKNAPDTTFIGKTIRRGWQQVMDRYKDSYSTKEAMGKLEFSDLTVRMLGPEHAVVTGKYHLTRTAAGGGDASGIFSLVWEKSAEGWKIILDHTS